MAIQQPIYTQIEKTIQTSDGNIVMESHNGFPFSESNLYLVSPNGTVIWKAEKADLRSLYTRIKLNEDFTLSTFTTDGLFCEIDLKTGKIISKSSFK
ncbi:MAG: hypothetical protein IH588_18965 [Anaerolineales bacterium]|nr:hypothetical protein [Anaerolineales bacterium]